MQNRNGDSQANRNGRAAAYPARLDDPNFLRAQAHKIFSVVFRYPDRALLQLLHDPQLPVLLTALHARSPKLFAWLGNGQAEAERLQALQVEYTGLFINAYPAVKAPPYASFYLHQNQLMGPVTADILQAYHAQGFRLAAGEPEPPDHLSIMLAFLSHAIAAGMSYEHQQAFLERFLGWHGAFVARIIENAALPVYPAFAKALNRFLRDEKAYLEKRSKEAL